MPISRRDLLRRTAVGVAAVPFLCEGALDASTSNRGSNAGEQPLHLPIRLTSNRNPYGPSRGTTDAMLAAVESVNVDSREQADALRDSIASHHRVPREQVVLAAGSCEILRLAVNAYLVQGRTLVTASPTFDAIGRYAARAGRQLVAVPLSSDFSHDLDALLSRCDSRTALVYICNPNNPTGRLSRRRDLEAFIQRLPATTHVVIDEAYHHYVDEASDYSSFIEQPVDDSRLIVTRSFSKLYGLAGLRIGYAIADRKAAPLLEAHRTSEGVNTIAASAAIAALADPAHVAASRTRNADDRQEFFNQANARMARCIDSQTNFVMITAERPAADLVAHFKSHRIELPDPYPWLEKYLRVSLGTRQEMQEFWRVWDLMPGGGHHHMSGTPRQT